MSAASNQAVRHRFKTKIAAVKAEIGAGRLPLLDDIPTDVRNDCLPDSARAELKVVQMALARAVSDNPLPTRAALRKKNKKRIKQVEDLLAGLTFDGRNTTPYYKYYNADVYDIDKHNNAARKALKPLRNALKKIGIPLSSGGQPDSPHSVAASHIVKICRAQFPHMSRAAMAELCHEILPDREHAAGTTDWDRMVGKALKMRGTRRRSSIALGRS